MTRMPVVAIIGRPNVGKSSLLNALAGRLISIVEDTPGVTRDRVSAPVLIDGRYVELVDTGGYGFDDQQGLTEHIHHQIELAMARADLVLLVVDCRDGPTAADEEIVALLRRRGLKTVLIANKADGPKMDPALGEFARLGLGTPLGVSALSGRNLDAVRRAIASGVDLRDAPRTLPEPEMLLAIVGKRNAGKSTLVNAIAALYEGDDQRVIVSEVPGTTRDSIDVRLTKNGRTIVVIDTAGVRKKRQMVTHDLEFYGFHRAQRSIRRADVVLLLIDATEPVSEPDKKLAQYIAEQYKPTVVVVNKWDLAREILAQQAADAGSRQRKPSERRLMQQYREYLDRVLPGLDYAPIAFTSARDGQNVEGVLETAQHLFAQARLRVGTGRLNAAIRKILGSRAPSNPVGRPPKIYYATQVETTPPTIVLFVNDPSLIDEAYRRFVVNRLRELLPYAEVPIRLVVRARDAAGAEHARP